jgi:hypothetical protein
MSPTTQNALRELLWLSSLLLGFLLMISAATEGFPYTSIHIRNELAQDAIGALGLALAVFMLGDLNSPTRYRSCSRGSLSLRL